MTGVQMPAAQLKPSPQMAPQEPQLVGLVARSTHWPLHVAGRWPRQPHFPDTHWSPLGQASPQVPQLLASVDKFTHAPLQSVVPGPQPAAHFPCAQTSPVGQMRPH